MDIAQYIAEILREKDEVSIPGLGKLYKKKSGIIYSQSDKSYSISDATLLFTPEITSAQTLIQYIQEVKRISPASAEYFVDKFAENLRKDLGSSGKADINPVGTFNKIGEAITFTAGSDTYRMLDDYGLIPVRDIEPAGTIQETSGEFSTISPNTSLQEEDALGESYEEDEDRRSRWPYIIVGIIILIILAVITYLRYPETFDILLKPGKTIRENKNDNIPILKPDTLITLDTVAKPKNEADSIALADSILIKKAKDEGLDIEKAPDTISNISTEVKKLPAKDSTTYEVIGSTFWRKSEADNYTKFMRKKGVYTKVVTKPGKRIFYISLGTFSTQAKANEERKRIVKEISKEAWILELKTNTNP